MKNKPKRTAITTDLPPVVFADVRRLAELAGKKASAYIRDLLTDHVEQKKGKLK